MVRWLFAAVLLLATGMSQAQDIAAPDISAEFEEHIAALSEFTEERRGLRLPEPLPLHFPTRAELAAFIERQFDLALDQATLDRALRFYAVFGWLPADTDLRALLETFYTAQVAGFYNTETREMSVVLLSTQQLGDRLPILEQIVYVHEYTHALQDAAFDLAAYLEESRAVENSDRQLARLALVEGDAMMVMNDFAVAEAERNPLGVLMGLFLGGLRAGNLTLPPGIPDIIVSELLFPYTAGEVFVRTLYAQAGWDGVNAAFDNPPTTTEQILHPQKYLDGEVGDDVRLTDRAARLGGGWALVDQGVLGQFYLTEFLGKQLSDLDAAQAAAGWGGDAFHIYQDADGRLAAGVRLEWDTAADLAEFQQAIAAYGESRYGMAADASGCFADDASALCSDGRLIAIAPTVALARLLMSE